MTIYSRSKFKRMAKLLSTERLELNAMVANQESHHCNFCFYCVCKEVLQKRLDLEALEDLVKLDMVCELGED